MTNVPRIPQLTLTLFLSRATPLQRWHKLGLFEREVALYQRLQPYLQNLQIVTSGGAEELDYQDELAEIRILCNQRQLAANFYSLVAPLLHRQALQQSNIFKTNQIDGAWTALIAGGLYNKPVIVRAGYPWSDNFHKEYGAGFKAILVKLLEKLVLQRANHIIVTTPAIKETFVQAHHLPPAKISVIPNYVDTDIFRPQSETKKIPGRICFVGRLNPVKNLPLLIEAVASLPQTTLVIIGNGSERQNLVKLAEQLGVKVEFKGVMPNTDLPAEINQAEMFILPSKFEGHPKALLEAMACGAPVIGTNVSGIKQIIRHEETGLLCTPTVTDIREAVQYLLNNPARRIQLGVAAQAFAWREYSLSRIVQLELTVLQRVVHGR